MNSKAVDVSIETDHLEIKSYKSCDIQNSIQLYSDPEITKYFDTGHPKPESEILSYVTNTGINAFNHGHPFGLFSIFEKGSEKFIGHIDLVKYTDDEKVLEVGYILLKPFQGKGYGSEAAKAIIYEYIPYLQQSGYDIQKVIATVHPDNIPSQKVLQKLGFSFEKSEERFNNPRYWYCLPIYSDCPN